MQISLKDIPSDRLQPVMDCVNKDKDPVIFDFSEKNESLKAFDLNDETAFNAYIFDTIREHQSSYGIGRYNEDRVIYKRSDVFGTARTVHLGIDIWAPAGSSIYAPFTGQVHSFRDNDSHGDYGPTIILRHEWAGITFHTLYGHLNRSSLKNLKKNEIIEAGTQFTSLGTYEENVHWPPHLHFQVIIDMEGKHGDYPGVCSRDERSKFLDNCPDPNLILRIPALEQQNIRPV